MLGRQKRKDMAGFEIKFSISNERPASFLADPEIIGVVWAASAQGSQGPADPAQPASFTA